MNLQGKPLTARERQVLQIHLTGRGRTETARALGLSVNTVSTHMVRVQRKLGARNPFHALILFLRTEVGAAIEPFYSELEARERSGALWK